jgi:hypothetical protein
MSDADYEEHDAAVTAALDYPSEVDAAASVGAPPPDSTATLLCNECCRAVQFVRADGNTVTRHIAYKFWECAVWEGASKPDRLIKLTRWDIEQALRHLRNRFLFAWEPLKNLYHVLSSTPEHLRRHEDWMDAAKMAAGLAEVVEVRNIDLGEWFGCCF